MSNALNTNHCRVLGGNFHKGFFDELEAWVATVPGAHFDRARGVSYINGNVFFSDLYFETEEDMLVCKIKFAGKVV